MKQLKSLSHLLYDVEKVESKSILPDFDFTPAQEFAIVVNKDGKKKIVNHCSKIYEVVPNRQVIEPLVKAFANENITISGNERHDSRFEFNILFSKHALNLTPKDTILPRLRIFNSYDGRVRYSFALGFFRLICKNGMVIPAEGFEDYNTNIKLRHTPSIGEVVDPEAIEEMVNNFKKGLNTFAKPYQELNKKKVVSLEDRIQEVIENTKFPTRRAEDVLERIELEMAQLSLKPKAASDWLVYSGLNYQLNHSTDITMDSHKKEKLDQQVLTYLINN